MNADVPRGMREMTVQSGMTLLELYDYESSV